MILNLYAPNSGAPNFKKKILWDLKTWININPLIVGDFNTSFTPTDRPSGQKPKEKQQN